MFDRLLLKIIGARLVEPGSCPYNQHCIHAGHNGCLATKEELKRREAAIKAEAEKEEPHRPIIVYLTLTRINAGLVLNPRHTLSCCPTWKEITRYA